MNLRPSYICFPSVLFFYVFERERKLLEINGTGVFRARCPGCHSIRMLIFKFLKDMWFAVGSALYCTGYKCLWLQKSVPNRRSVRCFLWLWFYHSHKGTLNWACGAELVVYGCVSTCARSHLLPVWCMTNCVERLLRLPHSRCLYMCRGAAV